MKRIILSIVWGLLTGWAAVPCLWAQSRTGTADREIWVKTLVRLADPVLSNLANETLKKEMPYESLAPNRQRFSYLEAVGRTVCGIAPWLELGEDDTPEGQLRKKYIELTVKGISNAVNPSSPDYLIFGEPSQPLVDAAFLAEGLLRAPKQLWGNLSPAARKQVVTELKRSRVIKPNESNWLLFASIVEAALPESEFLNVQQKRLGRYAEQLERFISPEGTYPVIGRSIVYRTGVFHALGQAALLHLLPQQIVPAQVRCGMTKVIENQFRSATNFDTKGWLKIGFSGNQVQMSESYINTGSTYLCLTGFLPLGLPADDPFWSAPPAEWTNLKAWSGKEVPTDHSL